MAPSYLSRELESSNTRQLRCEVDILSSYRTTVATWPEERFSPGSVLVTIAVISESLESVLRLLHSWILGIELVIVAGLMRGFTVNGEQVYGPL